jgi:hypothetical protein
VIAAPADYVPVKQRRACYGARVGIMTVWIPRCDRRNARCTRFRPTPPDRSWVAHAELGEAREVRQRRKGSPLAHLTGTAVTHSSLKLGAGCRVKAFFESSCRGITVAA